MDIGSLTGHITLEDQLTGKLTTVLVQVRRFAENFDGALGAVAIGVGATAAAVAGLTASIVGLGVKGSTILGVEEAFNRLAEASGSTGEALLTGLDRGLRGTVDSMEQMQAVSRAMTAGIRLSADEMELLGSAARAIGKATGTDATQGLERLSTALATGQTRTLRSAGLLVDLSDAETKYAEVHGLVASQLTVTQQLEAKREAILQATRTYVDRLGESEVSLKERLQQTTVAIGNWFDNLSKAVAQSQSVSRAMDAIRGAIESAFGGTSKDLLEFTVKWINRFADAVATYAPPVIEAFGWIYNRVRDIWKAVTDAWDLVPDWLKNIARDAALATAAMYLTGKVVGDVATGLGQLGTGAQTSARSVVSEWSTITDATISLGRLFKETIPAAITYTTVAFTAARLAINSLGVSIALAALWPAVLVGVTAAVVAVGAAGYQAFKLWEESSERAASATNQLAYDQANLERLNTAMGTSFKDVNEAAAAYRDSVKDLAPAVEQLSEADRLSAEAAEFHRQQVDKLFQTIASAAATVDVTSEAFDKLTLAQKNTLEAQKLLIPLLDEHIAKGVELTEAEKKYYETVVVSRLNLEQHNVAALAAQEVTLERIKSMRAMGMAETEIAQKLGTTVVALKEYSTNLTQLKVLTEELNAVRIEMTGTAADAAIAGYQREYQAAVDALDKTSVHYAETMAKLAALRDARVDAEGSSWVKLASQSQEALRQMADAAQRDYERMLFSGLHFTREVLDAQREKVRQLRFEAEHMGQSYQSALVVVQNEAAKAAKEMNDLIIATLDAKRAADALVSFSFDLDPSDPRYVPPGAHRAPTRDNMFNWEWDDPTKPKAGRGNAASTQSDMMAGAARDIVPRDIVPRDIVPTSVVNTFYVNGTAQDVARQVSKEIMVTLKQARRFGAA